MRVTVDVVGDRTEEVTIEEGTYGDLLAAVDLSPHEASVFVDGRPKPADESVTEREVQVVRLVQGG
ncbi:MAG: ubiquitin-like small modifier protein SAMP2 [Halodesulfurarchaeum sp.]